MDQHLKSHDHHSASIHNEMTTPKGFHDATTPTENVVGFIISDLLQIAMFPKYLSLEFSHIYSPIERENLKIQI